MRDPEIIATSNGFAIVSTKSTEAISLDEVSAIVVYKIDALTTDLVCCEIVIGAGDTRRTHTVHEGLHGFDAVMVLFEDLPAFNRRWRDEIILPPFATNRTVIYNRIASID